MLIVLMLRLTLMCILVKSSCPLLNNKSEISSETVTVYEHDLVWLRDESKINEYINSKNSLRYFLLFVLLEDKYANTSQSIFSIKATKRPLKRKKITKKRNDDNKMKRPMTNCKKLDFNVNFVELGWDKWIIFPKIFNAHMCSGDCSLPFKNHNAFFSSSLRSSIVTNHAQIMSILEYKHPNRNKLMTKCVSTKLKPLTVVFLDENGFIKTKQYEDMIVDECGCR
jgi:hypothetical protein